MAGPSPISWDWALKESSQDTRAFEECHDAASHVMYKRDLS